MTSTLKPTSDRFMTLCFSFTGHHVVPEPTSEDETGHGGAEEGCRECENPDDSQELPGERQRHEHPSEEIRQRSRLRRRLWFA